MSDSARFQSAQQRLASVLGVTSGSVGLAIAVLEQLVWPSGLLVVEDYGCGIDFAVDLDDRALRVIRASIWIGSTIPKTPPALAAWPTRSRPFLAKYITGS